MKLEACAPPPRTHQPQEQDEQQTWRPPKLDSSFLEGQRSHIPAAIHASERTAHHLHPSGAASSCHHHHHQYISLTLALLLVINCAALASAHDAAALQAYCKRFHAFKPGIAEDLLPWHDQEGVSEELMDRTIRERTMLSRVPGLPLCIHNGQLYVVDGRRQSIGELFYWQAENIVVYAWALSRLVARWGSALPDVEFVLETMDAPVQDLGTSLEELGKRNNPSPDTIITDEFTMTPNDAGEVPPSDVAGGVWGKPHGRLPVMRHCKTSSSPDIAVPIFHFYTYDYDLQFLSAIERFNSDYPWETRLKQAFAAGVRYHRVQSVPSTLRQWDGIHRGETVEMVRSAFRTYLQEELRHPNITYSEAETPLKSWGRYKMVMHVDGISCSSRIWQLLTLGSVVLREQSGYFAFYDRLLRKFQHYVPFWSHRPREILWAYNWVMANDEAAHEIALRGQQFVRKFLNREAIECYWVLLLQEYAKLLRFAPGKRRSGGAGGGGNSEEHGPRKLELVPVAEWLTAQDGVVSIWPSDYVAKLVDTLNLLPKDVVGFAEASSREAA